MAFINLGDFCWAVRRKSPRKSLPFMPGIENMMTHGDPYRIKVIACKEVSFTIVGT